MNSLLESRTGGDPDNEVIVDTDLPPTRLAEELAAMNTPASHETVRQWLEEQGLKQRKIRKALAGGSCADRNTQLENIAALIDEQLKAGEPCYSMDTKAKERLGKLFRQGRVRSSEPFLAFDHDFPSWAAGVISPHGIYDLARNHGHINIGLSHDTSEFACDSFQWFWNRIGKQCYPNAQSILLLLDCGGSNSAAQYLFKQDLQNVVNAIGVPIRVASPFKVSASPVPKRSYAYR